MAECKKTAQEFVQSMFAPMVASLCSPDAEMVCQKNNLSFVELIQPFCRLTAEAHIRDPGNISHTVHNLHLDVHNMNTLPPQPTLARKLLNDSVANTLPNQDITNVMTVGSYDLQLSPSTPWFESYRETFLQTLQSSEHEFLKHFLACIFVVSSSHASPMEQFASLTQQQHQQQHQQPNKLPHWFCPNVLNYYVLIHDVAAEDLNKAESVYQSMKSTYGVNSCHLLQINSHSMSTSATDTPQSDHGTVPDPWSQFLPRRNTSNHDGVSSAATGDEGGEGDLSRVSKTNGTDCEVTVVEKAEEMTEEVEVQENNTGVTDHPLSLENNIGLANDDNSLLVKDSQNNAMSLDGDTGYVTTSTGVVTTQHGCCLTLSDHDRLRIFIHEFIVRGLIPWAERMLRTLSEQVTTRKGLHRSLFSATKKWFGGSKPVGQAMMAEKTNVIYTSEAPEMQLRRLGDLAFMFQLYEHAYQTYHTCKRDFNNDHAWLHYAGAQEMACMSVFMQGANSQRPYPQHYIESAVSTYLGTCRAPAFAARATLLSTEALKSKGMYAEAATLLIKMTSEVPDSDLHSALFLEQAAHCFIRMKHVMVRKYAFHMILAGHRFNKASQRRHALRSYTQAMQVYKGKDWSLAEDHINFTIGRQCFNLKQLNNAMVAFKHLLGTSSKQPSIQQAAFLREYLFVYRQYLAQHAEDGATSELPQLPLPSINNNATKVLCTSVVPCAEEKRIPATSVYFDYNESDNPKWQKLEALIVVSNKKSFPLNFKPCIQCFTNRTQNSTNPIAVVEEVITVEICLENPMSIPLLLLDVRLLWSFLAHAPDSSETPSTPLLVTNENHTNKNQLSDELVGTQAIPEILLEASETKRVHLSVTAHATGELHVTGVVFNLGTSLAVVQPPVTSGSVLTSAVGSSLGGMTVRGKLVLDVQGPRLADTKEERNSKVYGPDCRLDIIVAPPMPQLQVYFCDFPESMLCGEVRHVTLELTNTGPVALCNVKMSTTQPQFFTFGLTPVKVTSTGPCITPEQDIKHVVSVPCDRIEPGQTVQWSLWIRGRCTPGTYLADMLFYYESTDTNPNMSHRVLRHTTELTMCQSLQLTSMAVWPAGHCKKDHLDSVTLSLEVLNTNTVTDNTEVEFEVTHVVCASRQWQLRQPSSYNSAMDTKVKSRENTLLCLAAQRCPLVTEEKQIAFTSVSLGSNQMESNLSEVCSDFYFRSKSLTQFNDIQVEPLKPNSMDRTDTQTTSLLDSALAVELTLIVVWKAVLISESGDTHKVEGQHQVSLEELGTTVTFPPVVKVPLERPSVKIIQEPVPDVSPRPDPRVLSQLVPYSLTYSQTVTHDFLTDRLCYVPVTLSIFNMSEELLDVYIDTSPNIRNCDAVDTTTQPAVVPCPPTVSHVFSWTGMSHVQTSLDARQPRSVRLCACFSRPGVYNLGTLQVSARPHMNSDTSTPVEGAAQFVPQKVAGPFLVVISGDRPVT